MTPSDGLSIMAIVCFALLAGACGWLHGRLLTMQREINVLNKVRKVHDLQTKQHERWIVDIFWKINPEQARLIEAVNNMTNEQLDETLAKLKDAEEKAKT